MIDDDLPTRRLQRLVAPAGGELRLRRALAADPRTPRWPLPLAATVLASVLVFVAVAYRPDPQRERIRQALQLALSPQQEIQVEGADVAVVPGTNPRVRIYTVAAGRPPDRKPSTERPGGSGSS